jgi:hypothetical protein
LGGRLSEFSLRLLGCNSLIEKLLSAVESIFRHVLPIVLPADFLGKPLEIIIDYI